MSEIIKKIYFTCKKKLTTDGEIQKYCQCDGCYRVTNVNVMKFPYTKYWNRKDLTTKYTTRWYCDECVGKLRKAIQDNRLKYFFDLDCDYEELKAGGENEQSI